MNLLPFTAPQTAHINEEQALVYDYSHNNSDFSGLWLFIYLNYLLKFIYCRTRNISQ